MKSIKSYEPFRRAFQIPPGMVQALPFKEDPRYRGKLINTPRIADAIVLRPHILFLIPRIVVWTFFYFLFKDEPYLGTAGIKFIFYAMGILDLGSAIPKFLFEKTILTPEGIKRSFLFYEMFFKWDDIHQINHDSLSISFRIKKGWGIWLDEFNIIISNLYYAPSEIRKVTDIFAKELGD